MELLGLSYESANEEDATDQRVIYPTYEVKADTNDITVVAPPHLRSIIIKGHIATFTRLSRLFALASTSLRTIKMKIFSYSIINSDEIDAIASHIDFQFDVDYMMIGTPAGFDW